MNFHNYFEFLFRVLFKFIFKNPKLFTFCGVYNSFSRWLNRLKYFTYVPKFHGPKDKVVLAFNMPEDYIWVTDSANQSVTWFPNRACTTVLIIIPPKGRLRYFGDEFIIYVGSRIYVIHCLLHNFWRLGGLENATLY